MCRICGCEAVGHHDHDHHDHDHHDHDHHDHDHHEHRRTIAIGQALLDKNDRIARAVRARLEDARVAAINVIGTPGAGKTTLLEQTLRALSELAIAVIEGDQATDHDARRIAATGRRVVQINTDAGCHLDAGMMARGLDELAPAPGSLVFVENVGNLVCPALFDLGERAKVAVMSVTEGEDKPLKYPHVIRAASALVVTKADLLPHLEIDITRMIDHARRVNPSLVVIPVSATRGHGMAEWYRWLREHAARGDA